MQRIRWVHWASGVVWFFAAMGQAAILPPMKGILDVTKPPFNADLTGKVDATAAIQAALDTAGYSQANIVYLPAGTYLISNTLKWANRRTRDMLEGEGADKTIIRLKDFCPGYQDTAVTRAMVWTGGAPAQRFRNHLRDLTFNTGKGNPGATGVQFIANNQGGMDGVRIVSEDGQGVYGLDLGYTNEQGPCLIARLQVSGFDVGVRTRYGVDGVVLEDVLLEKQNQAGFVNDGQCVSFRKLVTRDQRGPSVHNKRGSGLLALIDSRLAAAASAGQSAAIVNEAGLFARNISTSGYAQAIRNSIGGAAHHAGPDVVEFASHPVLSLFPSPKRSLGLAVREPPPIPWDASADWVDVTQFAPRETLLVREDGSRSKYTDWAPALQKAIDAGKTTVYFPPGVYGLFDTVRVRGKVRRIIGMESEIKSRHGHHLTLKIEAGDGPVAIERIDATYGHFTLIQAAPRTLVVRNMAMERMHVQKGAGDLFLEDVVGGYLELEPGTRVWARQLNLEGWNEPRLLNRGGEAWVLGIKTENDSTLCKTVAGGKTEILGGFIYANKATNPDKVMFRIENASMSATVGEFVGRSEPYNPVVEMRDGVTKTLRKGEAPGRAGGSMLVLFTGYDGNTAAPVARPESAKLPAPADIPRGRDIFDTQGRRVDQPKMKRKVGNAPIWRK